MAALTVREADLLRDLAGRSYAARSVDVASTALKKFLSMRLVEEYADVCSVQRARVTEGGRVLLERLASGAERPTPRRRRAERSPAPNTALIAEAAKRKIEERQRNQQNSALT